MNTAKLLPARITGGPVFILVYCCALGSVERIMKLGAGGGGTFLLLPETRGTPVSICPGSVMLLRQGMTDLIVSQFIKAVTSLH